jgi:fatty acid synthase
MTLKVKVRHVSNQDGFKIIEVTTEDQTGRVVLKGTARVAQKSTAYVFTGQGSQVAGMGMLAYQESEAARAIWDRVDKYCQNELGFSIIKVVRDNPKEMLVDGHKVFHPKGVLHLTQFAQVGLTVLALAQMTELKAAGLYQKDAMFAGHSLGEYAGLGCFGILSIEDMVRVVYHRGLTMQHFVPRDAEGRSPFGMVVIRPSAIGWTQADLEARVEGLTRASKGEAIYVVNYNIEGSQYSITGHLSLLKKLQTEIKEIEVNVGATKSACIWVEGVDVPFHSPLLRDGVEAFRKTLQHTISEFHPEFLVDRYVPNLNAEPFRLDKDYADNIFKLTESPVLKDVIKNWSEHEKNPGELSRILLIELLAYQFASPVRWIQTQKVFLTHPKYLVDRVIEIGPSPVLSNMMKATAGKVSVVLAPEIHQFDTERDAVFYRYEPVIEETPVATSAVTADQKSPSVVVERPIVSASVGNVPVPQDKTFGPERGLR